MKIAITAEDNKLNSNVSPVFGRNPYIMILNLENYEIKSQLAIENPEDLKKGAGNIASEFLVNQNIDVLISREMGPIAFYILKNAGIIVYKATMENVEKNLKLFTDGKLKEVTSISSGYPK
ncbi:MAG TPA: NifB/NifX family molybdenum-iron cluster-binding protein [Methanobacterium sp.]|nr:NifB/NifX family molybdenum-iron cluster-binding protein [Methanobacterium sp.]